jgi:hypothetical protein
MKKSACSPLGRASSSSPAKAKSAAASVPGRAATQLNEDATAATSTAAGCHAASRLATPRAIEPRNAPRSPTRRYLKQPPQCREMTPACTAAAQI